MIYALFFMLFSQAHAAEGCPNITGTFSCKTSTLPFELQAQTSLSDPQHPRYTFTSSSQGTTEVIADGREHEFKNKKSQGTAKSSCHNGRLVVEFRLIDKNGQISEFREEMYMERLAIVRIRFPANGTPEASSCRPVFAHPQAQ